MATAVMRLVDAGTVNLAACVQVSPRSEARGRAGCEGRRRPFPPPAPARKRLKGYSAGMLVA
jgi:hypothetical protein